MTRTAITVQTAITPFGAYGAGLADITFAAGDAVNGNTYVCTGKELLIVQNEGAAPYTVTIDSVDDEKGRQEDITAYSLAIGDFAVFTVGMTTSKGWKQAGGVINVDVENAGVTIAVIRLP